MGVLPEVTSRFQGPQRHCDADRGSFACGPQDVDNDPGSHDWRRVLRLRRAGVGAEAEAERCGDDGYCVRRKLPGLPKRESAEELRLRICHPIRPIYRPLMRVS